MVFLLHAQIYSPPSHRAGDDGEAVVVTATAGDVVFRCTRGNMQDASADTVLFAHSSKQSEPVSFHETTKEEMAQDPRPSRNGPSPMSGSIFIEISNIQWGPPPPRDHHGPRVTRVMVKIMALEKLEPMDGD